MAHLFRTGPQPNTETMGAVTILKAKMSDIPGRINVFQAFTDQTSFKFGIPADQHISLEQLWVEQ